jgi:hypothetical protein
MIQQYYKDYQGQGITVIPIEWDSAKMQPVSHRKWSDTSTLSINASHNGIMIKCEGSLAALDFDIKNTPNKELFNQFKAIITHQRPEIYDKLYIESTRTSGYHLWLRYGKLQKKLSLAESEVGSEVIALYACGPLVYTYPTPGYNEYSGSMQDIETLSDDEFEYLISLSQHFNEYKPAFNPTNQAVSYPQGLEQYCLDFDHRLTDENWAEILEQSGLVCLTNYRYNSNDKFTAFKRVGSSSDAISAKVYYYNKKVMIFTASLHEYPNWHNRHDYPVWALTPCFMLFYQLGRDWQKVVERMQLIADSSGFELTQPVTYQGDYPVHVFPDSIRRSILEVSKARSLSVEFLATSGLWTVSSLAGTHYRSDFNGDGKNILFCLLIAPVSVGKTPAYKAMCENPLRKIQENADKNFTDKIIKHENDKADAMNGKKKFIDKRPNRYIPFAVDGTTEGYVALSMDQPNGIGVYHDEAETIFNAGSFKGTNDSISFFTQAFGGGRYTQIRADREKERIVPNLNINLMMGTQPSRLSSIFTSDRLASGFASRFLMVKCDYMQLNTEVDPFTKGKEMCEEWIELLNHLYISGEAYNRRDMDKVNITMSDEAKQIYRQYYKLNLEQANERITAKSEHIGTEAKMSTYFPRLVQILAIIHNPATPVITEQTIHDAYDLYRYYSKTTVDIVSGLTAEATTGLPEALELIYQALPNGVFNLEQAKDACKKINVSERKFQSSMRIKEFNVQFRKLSHGTYEKI